MNPIRTAITAAVLLASVSLSPATDWRDSPSFVRSRQLDLPSAITGHTYRIFVSVPETPPPADGYPVLYTLDGDTSFPLAAFLVQSAEPRAAAFGITPGIVVGIGYTGDEKNKNARAEDYTPPPADLSDTGDLSGAVQGGAGRFLDFLEKDLKPLIASEFRIDPARQTLFGHSYGGLFTLHVLFTRPALFRHYVAGSPSIWWANRHILSEKAAFEKNLLPPLKSAGAVPDLVIGVGSTEQTPRPDPRLAHRAEMVIRRRQVDNARELAAALSASGLSTRFYLYEDEGHGSARVPAINRAVQVAFAAPEPAAAPAASAE
ncbi:putative hydrolase of alpha/beta superfamily [Opitutaceae bacterium TAV1]|nr:putative hydrolase of alpha/beta superfamily [Opitutaceae bacterium TAV1]